LSKTAESAKRKKRRLANKVKCLSKALEKCKTDLSVENFQTISDKAEQIPAAFLNSYQTKLSGKTVLQYDETIRSFALSLHLKSAKAYRYVRKCFKNALPSERTIRSWCGKLDFSPGFCKHAFKLLECRVKEQEAKGCKLLCSLTLDEMAIKKHMDFSSKFLWFGYIVKLT